MWVIGGDPREELVGQGDGMSHLQPILVLLQLFSESLPAPLFILLETKAHSGMSTTAPGTTQQQELHTGSRYFLKVFYH